MRKIEFTIDKICMAIGLLAYAGIIAMSLLNIADIFMTKAFQANIQGAYELTERLMMCTVFASLGYAEMRDAHIHTTLFIARLPRVVKLVIYGLTGALAAAANIFWTNAIYIQIGEVIRKSIVTDVLKIPMAPFYVYAFICMIAFDIALVWHCIKTFAALKNKEFESEITGTWA